MTEKKPYSTIVDVAREAGVSIGTVSRYINGLSIRQYNIKPIEDAIRKLDFQPDETARQMKIRNSRLVGMLSSGYDQFHVDVIKTVSRILEEAGYILLVYNVDPFTDAYTKAVEFFRKRKFDGLILSGNTHAKLALSENIGSFRNVVVFNNCFPSIDIDKVVTDNADAAIRCVDYLAERNHSKIGFITGNLLDSSAVDRFQGYASGLKKHGIEMKGEYVVNGKWTVDSGYLAGEKFIAMKDRPTAVISSNYLMTFGFIKAMNEHGLSIPDDFSIISFDDVDAFSISRPKITAMVQSEREIGECIAAMMIDRIEGRYSDCGRVQSYPAYLVERESVKVL